jgi:hypothetical protein
MDELMGDDLRLRSMDVTVGWLLNRVAGGRI